MTTKTPTTFDKRDEQMLYFYNCLLRKLPSLDQEIRRCVLARIWEQLQSIPAIRQAFENKLREEERDVSLENYAALFGMALIQGGITPVVRRPLNHLGIPPLRDNAGEALSYQEFYVDLMNFVKDYLPAEMAKKKLSAQTTDHINKLTHELLEHSNSQKADELVRQKLKEVRSYVSNLKPL